MGGLLSSINSETPTEEDRTMAGLVIPATLEKHLALGDGCTDEGCPVLKALGFDQDEVANLYSVSETEFKFAFQEHGVAYDETSATDCLVEATVGLQAGASASSGVGFSLALDSSRVQMWGINFAGRVIVKHQSGEERSIYLPGTRTYDPAGMTGMYTKVCGLFTRLIETEAIKRWCLISGLDYWTGLLD